MQDNRNRHIEFQPSRHEMRGPIISNVVLAVATAAVLWWAFTSYQNDITVQTAAGSRYLTMEWNLLQELKSQTDAQLKEKEQEIASLRRQYARLLAQGGTASDESAIRDLERQLAEAEAQRKSLLQDRIEVVNPTLLQNRETQIPSTASGGTTTGIARSSPADTPQRNDSPVTTLLRREIDVMEERLSRSEETQRQLIVALEESEARRAALETRINETIARLPSRLPTDDDAPSETLPAGGETTLNMIATRAVVRAVITSPEIRREYPDLVDRLDEYIATVEVRARQAGRREAYAEASEAIEAIAAELEVPLNARSSGDSAGGYGRRLISLLQDSLTRISSDSETGTGR